MKIRPRAVLRRSGVAAVEMALVMNMVIVPTLIGTLEVGRLVSVQQIVANSAREGSRLAAQAVTITSAGVRIEVRTNTGNPSVQSAVYQYLRGAGLGNIDPSDVTVDFQFTAARSDGQAATEPYQGEMLQPFKLVVTVQYDKLRWINFGFVQTTSVSYTVDWRMLVDKPFVINPDLPIW